MSTIKPTCEESDAAYRERIEAAHKAQSTVSILAAARSVLGAVVPNMCCDPQRISVRLTLAPSDVDKAEQIGLAAWLVMPTMYAFEGDYEVLVHAEHMDFVFRYDVSEGQS